MKLVSCACLLHVASAFLRSNEGRSLLSNLSFTDTAPTKAVFVAGIEGTGHHLFGYVFDQCIKDNATSGCYIKPEGMNPPIPYSSNALYLYKQDSEPPLPAFKNISEGAKASDAKLIVLNTPWPAVDHASFPSCEADYFHGIAWPHLPTIVKSAKETDMDLVVMVLLRDVDQTYCSIKRRFGFGATRMRQALEEMTKQMDEVRNSTSFFCVDYQKLPAQDLNKPLGFTKYDLNAVMAKTFHVGLTQQTDSAHAEQSTYMQQEMKLLLEERESAACEWAPEEIDKRQEVHALMAKLREFC